MVWSIEESKKRESHFTFLLPRITQMGVNWDLGSRPCEHKKHWMGRAASHSTTKGGGVKKKSLCFSVNAVPRIYRIIGTRYERKFSGSGECRDSRDVPADSIRRSLERRVKSRPSTIAVCLSSMGSMPNYKNQFSSQHTPIQTVPFRRSRIPYGMMWNPRVNFLLA